MFIEKSKTASVPARSEFGRNEPAMQLLVWRFTQRNGTRFRVAFHLGNFSVWEEGDSEKEVFRINLGILEEVTKRAKAAKFHAVMARDSSELTKRESREIWQQCAFNPELRFCSTTRHHPSKLGGWRKCLERAAQLLEGTGRRVPWNEEDVLFASER
jgi:hypothetical protein